MPTNLMNADTFTEKLKELRGMLSGTMTLARELAENALCHFENDGNLNFATELANALPANFGRQGAFIKWMKEHSPCLPSYNKDSKLWSFKKDKGATAIAFNVEEALKIAFWDYAPDTSVKLFSSADVDKRILGVIKSFKDEAKNKPQNDNAMRHLKEVEQALLQVAV